MTTIKFKKLNIEAYKPGKSSIRSFKKIIKLSANESALGVSTRVRKVISSKNINFFRYPLMTLKIISSIHFEALLLWKKGAIYRKRDKKVFNNLSYEEY